MNCLILGGNGFVGSHLADKLLHENHNVRIFDKYEEHYRKPIAAIDYCYGDFGNRGLVASALAGIEVVFHLVNTTLPKTSNDDPSFDIQSNLVETIHLLEQCVNKVAKIVFISSGGTVYGNHKVLPITEDFPTNPECSYGIMKLAIEKYLALFHHLYGLDYTIVRPSNPYGSRQNPNGIQGAISVFLGKLVRNEPIEIWGNGEVVRDYIYIKDLVDGIYQAATINSPSKIFNIGSGIGVSLNNLIQTMRNVIGKEIEVLCKPKRVFDVDAIYLDISRAKEELYWAPKTSLESGILETFEFVKSILERPDQI